MQKHVKHVTLVTELQYISTTDLLVTKSIATQRITSLTTIKVGLMAFVAILFASSFKSFYEGDIFNLRVFLSVVAAFYSIIVIIVFDLALGKAKAQKEIINDILAIRNSRSSSNASKRIKRFERIEDVAKEISTSDEN